VSEKRARERSKRKEQEKGARERSKRKEQEKGGEKGLSNSIKNF
jgi:hypothetical protein